MAFHTVFKFPSKKVIGHVDLEQTISDLYGFL